MSDYFLIKNKDSPCLDLDENVCQHLKNECIWKNSSHSDASRESHCSANLGTITSRISENTAKALVHDTPQPIIYHVHKERRNNHIVRHVNTVSNIPEYYNEYTHKPHDIPDIIIQNDDQDNFLEECRNKMSLQVRNKYLNDLLFQNYFTIPPSNIYNDVNQNCLASELLHIKQSRLSKDKKDKFIQQIIYNYPNIINWYNENEYSTLDLIPQEMTLDKRLIELPEKLHNILKLYLGIRHPYDLNLSNHYLSEIISDFNQNTPSDQNFITRMFYLFTKEDLHNWGLDTRNMRIGKIRYPNYNSAYLKNLSKIIKPGEFQQLAGIIKIQIA